MKRYLAVFRSRTDVLSFISDFNRIGGIARAVETPKQIQAGCGISAEVNLNQIELALKLIALKRYQSFFGLFKVEKRASKVITQRI